MFDPAFSDQISGTVPGFIGGCPDLLYLTVGSYSAIRQNYLSSRLSGPGPTAGVIFFVSVTKKTKQKKARAWRRALQSRLTLPLSNDAASLYRVRRCGYPACNRLR